MNGPVEQASCSPVSDFALCKGVDVVSRRNGRWRIYGTSDISSSGDEPCNASNSSRNSSTFSLTLHRRDVT